MSTKQIPGEFIATLPIKNERGEVVGEKHFVVYAGLLALAHDQGLDRIDATVVQMPVESNGMTAVVRAVVSGRRGTYSGLGDASPQNVNRKVVRHLFRVAETRAKARALRDYTNVGLVALDELGEDEADLAAVKPASTRSSRNGRGQTITDAQRRALWRTALALGHEGHEATAFLTSRLGCEPARATKEQASALLDALKNEKPRGASNAAE